MARLVAVSLMQETCGRLGGVLPTVPHTALDSKDHYSCSTSRKSRASICVEVSIVLLLWPWPFQTSGEQCFNIMACAFQIDDRVTIVRTQHCGSVRYVGATGFAPGLWIGLRLDEKVGKNNGSVKGKVYFECEDEHGIFARPTSLCLADMGPRFSKSSLLAYVSMQQLRQAPLTLPIYPVSTAKAAKQTPAAAPGADEGRREGVRTELPNATDNTETSQEKHLLQQSAKSLQRALEFQRAASKGGLQKPGFLQAICRSCGAEPMRLPTFWAICEAVLRGDAWAAEFAALAEEEYRSEEAQVPEVPFHVQSRAADIVQHLSTEPVHEAVPEDRIAPNRSSRKQAEDATRKSAAST
eukprot:s7387_g1.t3